MNPPEKDKFSYGGLNDSATDLWRKFLRLYEDKFYSFQYNVRVGQGIHPGADLTPAEAEQWKRLTQKRIDVVAERLGETWVIEISERPGLREFGQIVGYQHFARKYLNVQGVVRGATVSRFLGFDMGNILIKQNVMFFVFPISKLPRVPPTFLPTIGTAGVDFAEWIPHAAAP